MASRRAYSSALKILAVFGSRNTLGFIFVNNSCTYPVTTFRTTCVDVIVITVAVTQFIKKVLENSGGIISFFEQ